MGYILDLDLDRCSACGACAVACMDQNDIDIAGGDSAFRVVSALEQGPKYSYVSVACQHCKDAPCIVACPSGCLRKDEETGFTVYNTDNCIGCHSCAMACPFGAPTFGTDGKMKKCDGCAVRVDCGLEPACVAMCPTGALRLMEEEALEKEHQGRSLHNLAKQILKD